MSEGSSGGFTSFLKGSVDRFSSKKDVKFLPPQTKSKDGDTADSKAKSKKEHRRGQVRKAQIEHRQRKENYIKHLEQDVIKLRDMITAAEKEASFIKGENTSIKTTLSRSNISTNTAPSTIPHSLQQSNPPLSTTSFQSPRQSTSPTNLEFQSPQHSSGQSTSSLSDVSIWFDEFLDTRCLQISPHGTSNNAAVLNSPDIFNFPTNTLSQLPQTASGSEGSQKPLPPLPGQGSSSATPLQPDISSIAINFILALEHPCRTHFHALPSEFDPTGDPTGHELMASTLLYSHAPNSVFNNLDLASWTAPSLELTQLWQMSQSLPNGDFEITPVQAWFILSQNYDAKRVLGKLEELKNGIGKLVACWEFGAVMDELKFWDVVKNVLGEVG